MSANNLKGTRPDFNPLNSGIESSGDSKNWNDQSLWASFKSGDEEAFVFLYKEYANILYNYGCQFSSDHELVKDCLQDFFVYLRKKRSGLGDTSSIKLYLLKAFKRRVIDYIKKYSKETEKKEAFLFTQFPVVMSHEAVYIHKQMEEDQLANLDKALKTLDVKEREAIYYFYYEGLTYEQIAKILDFSHVSSARRLIYRALSNLRKFMFLVLLGLLSMLSFF